MIDDAAVLRRATCPEVERCDADCRCRDPLDVTTARCGHEPDDRCDLKRLDVRVATLGPNPGLVALERGARGDRLLGPPATLLLADAEVRKGQEVAAGAERELGQVGRALAAECLDRLADLQGVPDRMTEGLIHVCQLADHLAPGLPAELDHRLRELARTVEALHKGSVPDLYVKDDRIGAGGDLLRHDAGTLSGIESTVAVTSRSA